MGFLDLAQREGSGNGRLELAGGQVFVDELDSSRESLLVSRKAESGQTTEVVDHVGAQGEVSQEAGNERVRNISAVERAVEDDLSAPGDSFGQRWQRVSGDGIKDQVGALTTCGGFHTLDEILVTCHDYVIGASIEQGLLLGSRARSDDGRCAE